MKRKARVSVKWLLRDPAGRVPVWETYPRPVLFDGEEWADDEAFSLIIDLEGTPDSDGKQAGVAHFFAESAPQEKLSPGRKFAIYEGNFATLEGVVEEVLSE